MKNPKTYRILFIYFFILTLGCKPQLPDEKLKEGDLLFQDLNCGPLCNAIEAVTEGVNGKDFSHCAMVININDTLKVIEAIGTQVQINSLKDFFARSGDTNSIINITVARVKPEYKGLIPLATTHAKQLLGQPYDKEFILNNGNWYCSELLYEAFKEANGQKDFFELAPMTFKDPQSKAFFPAWVEYYKNLEKPIPEGEPGLNPGSISRSGKIDVITLDTLHQY